MRHRNNNRNRDVVRNDLPDFPEYIDFTSITLSDDQRKKMSTEIYYYAYPSFFRFGRIEMMLHNLWIWLTCAVFKRGCK